MKWFCLEGTIHLSLTNGSGQEVVLGAGKMIATDGTKLPQPVSFNIAALQRTSVFFRGIQGAAAESGPHWLSHKESRSICKRRMRLLR